MLVMLIMLNQTGDSWVDPEMGINTINIIKAKSKNASGRGNVNNVNTVKSL